MRSLLYSGILSVIVPDCAWWCKYAHVTLINKQTNFINFCAAVGSTLISCQVIAAIHQVSHFLYFHNFCLTQAGFESVLCGQILARPPACNGFRPLYNEGKPPKCIFNTTKVYFLNLCEHFKLAKLSLSCLLSMVFNIMLSHGYQVWDIDHMQNINILAHWMFHWVDLDILLIFPVSVKHQLSTLKCFIIDYHVNRDTLFLLFRCVQQSKYLWHFSNVVM